MTLLSRFVHSVTTLVGKVNWKTTKVLHPAEFDVIRTHLSKDYYIILTRHNGHLAAYMIALSRWVLSGFKEWGFYGHAFMNLEDTVKTDNDFRFIEATGIGTHYSNFNDVLDNQTGAVALLKPKSMTIKQWTTVLDKAKTELGKPYDTLFDLADDKALSCVELIRVALMAHPNYFVDFANFEAMIKKYKNLEPHMFYTCPDFEVVYEVRS